MKPLAAIGLNTTLQMMCAVVLGLLVGLAGTEAPAQTAEPDPTRADASDLEVDPAAAPAAETPEPKPEVEPEPETDTNPEAPATRSEDELVRAIRAQLEQLLANPYQAPASEQAPAQPPSETGAQPRHQTRGLARTAGLESIATRCEVLANNAADEAMRLSLLDLRARALAELARLWGTRPAPERGKDWLARLRAVGVLIQTIDHPHAQPIGAYWQLLAEIARLPEAGEPLQARQEQAQRLLRAYIRSYADDDAATERLADARLSLAQLLDERGDQAGAARQLGAIGELPPRGPRDRQARPIRERIARIGAPVRLDGVSTDTQRWDLDDHAGSPVLIHIYADAVEPSVKMIQQVRDAIEDQSLGGFSIVSLRVGEARPGTPTPPWPVLPVELKPGGVLDQLGIDALPTLIWLDDKGRLASIGNNIAVLDQKPPAPVEPDAALPAADGDTNAEPTPDPATEPEPDTEAEPGPSPEPDTDSELEPEAQTAPAESR